MLSDPLRPAAALLCAAGALAACRGVTDPGASALPDGAARYAPPAVYARWWAQVEACSGLTGPFAAYAWYGVPTGTVPHPSYPSGVAAYTETAARRVVIADRAREEGGVVRHEMLHALLGPAYDDPSRWHPPAYFQGRCEGWVDCPSIGCEDAGAPPPTAPADAPVVPASALDVRVAVAPATPSRTAADPWFQVAVRVTNPGPGPVWLDMGENYGTAADPEYPGVGYRIVRAGQAGILEGTFGFTRRGRVPFAPGQTRVAVFDVNAAGYPAGAYVALGFYGIHFAEGVATPFTVAP